MWIFLTIVLALAVILTVIWMLSVTLIIKTDQNGEMILRYRFLFRTFGEQANPNHPLVKIIKKGSGISRIEKTVRQSNIEKSGAVTTYAEILRILVDLLMEIGGLLKHCTAKKFQLNITCAGEDAADAAINYGACSAVVYPLIGIVHTAVQVRESGRDIQIGCDYSAKQDKVQYHVEISTHFGRLLAAFLRVAYAEAKRTVEEQTHQPHQSR